MIRSSLRALQAEQPYFCPRRSHGTLMSWLGTGSTHQLEVSGAGDAVRLCSPLAWRSQHLCRYKLHPTTPSPPSHPSALNLSLLTFIISSNITQPSSLPLTRRLLLHFLDTYCVGGRCRELSYMRAAHGASAASDREGRQRAARL